MKELESVVIPKEEIISQMKEQLKSNPWFEAMHVHKIEWVPEGLKIWVKKRNT